MNIKEMIDNMLKRAEDAEKKANREGFPAASMNMSMSMSIANPDGSTRDIDAKISRQGDEDPEISVVERTPRVYVDFHNTDTHSRVRLTTRETLDDIRKQWIFLKNGMTLQLHDEEVETTGVVRYSEEEKIWVAEIDWDNLKLIEKT